jgi:hypothetical protein
MKRNKKLRLMRMFQIIKITVKLILLEKQVKIYLWRKFLAFFNKFQFMKFQRLIHKNWEKINHVIKLKITHMKSVKISCKIIIKITPMNWAHSSLANKISTHMKILKDPMNYYKIRKW